MLHGLAPKNRCTWLIYEYFSVLYLADTLFFLLYLTDHTFPLQEADSHLAPRNDHTLGILCKYAGVSVADARNIHLPAFISVPNNKKWFLSVCGDFLSKKKIDIQTYLAQLFAGTIPCDEVAIMLVAMTFKRQFGIYYGSEFWCTNKDRDPWSWDGILLYGGKMRFIDTELGDVTKADCFKKIGGGAANSDSGVEESEEDGQRTGDSTESLEKDDPADADYVPSSGVKRKPRKHRPKSFFNLRPGVRPKRSMAQHSDAYKLPPKKRHLTSTLSHDESAPTVAEKSEKSDSESAKSSGVAAAGKSETYEPTGNKKSEKSDSESAKSSGVAATGKSETYNEPTSKSEKSTKPKPPKKTVDMSCLRRSTRIQERLKKSGVSINSDEDNTPEPTAPKVDIIEPTSPASPALENENQHENGSVQEHSAEPGTENNNDATESDKDAAVPPTAGNLSVTQHGIPKRNKKQRSFKCDVCDSTFGLVKELNAHYSGDHPEHVFKCSECNNTYASRNAQLRHERSHRGMLFSCNDCSYTCQFNYELKNHVKKHTGTGLYPCISRGCTKTFTTKKGMKQHLQVHQNLNLSCDVCGKDGFTTRGYLRQHKKGQHGIGFVSRCGFKSKHPTARRNHQKECEECARKLAERRYLAEMDSSDSDSDSSGSDDTSTGESVQAGSDSSSD